MNTGASAPMIVAFATLVRRNAVNVSAMSPAKKTPPSALAFRARHVGRRPLARKITAYSATPIHSR